MLQTMEYDMKDGMDLEEYLAYVESLLRQAEKDGFDLLVTKD
jgi:hypothetical protein